MYKSALTSSSLRYGTAVALSVVLLGCTVGPDYEQPKTDLPQNWMSADKDQISANATQRDWWKNFHDPILTELIAKATAGNFDVQIAEARIAGARAAQASADATLLPTGDAKASATREANQFAFPGNMPGLTKPFDIFQTGFDASWELDLFGGHRRAIESADADLQASEASRDDVMISVMAEVARTYVDIRQAQRQLTIAEDAVVSNAKTVDIMRQRSNAGVAPGLDLTQAEAQLQQAQTSLPLYRNALAQAEYGMDVLLGEQPGFTEGRVRKVKPIPVSNERLLLKAPAAVIANRPDIRVAERKLALATAQQGVAVAKFFPDISLSGFVGFLNTDAGNLMTMGSKSWSGSANMVWPILSYGTLSANLDAANAGQQEAMASYRKTMIAALSDVERSVTSYVEQDRDRQSLAQSVQANLRASDIAQQRYQQGLTSFLEVLEAQRTVLASQIQLAEAEASTSKNLISAYKSLGGGWALVR